MTLGREKTVNMKKWDYAADSWSDFVESKKDSGKIVIVPGILKLLPKGTGNGKRALDVCCGEGYYARILQKMGYEVSGVDISKKMIDIARNKTKGIEFRCADAARMDFLPSNSFDLVVCSMGLMDTPDLDGTLKEVRRVLKKSKCFVLSIVHPCFDRPRIGSWVRDGDGRKLHFKIDNYMKEEPLVNNWNMKRLKYPFETNSYHRILSTYVNALIENNLKIDQIHEPCVRDDGEIDEEEFRVPNFLIIRCVKG